MLNSKFWEKVRKTAGCWFWVAATSREGYGIVNINGHSELAHRASFEDAVRILAPNEKLVRTCDSKLCVRPDHYFTKTEEQRFWEKVRKTASCWLWTRGVDGKGYGAFRNAEGVQQLAHRVAWRLSGRSDPKGPLLHRCDNHRCVRPDHLFIGTQADNMADKVQKQRQARGENHGSARLTQHKVDEIRRRYASGEPQAALAMGFGVSQVNISNIVRGKTWKSEN